MPSFASTPLPIVSPSIVKRSDLLRVLTSDEVDSNFVKAFGYKFFDNYAKPVTFFSKVDDSIPVDLSSFDLTIPIASFSLNGSITCRRREIDGSLKLDGSSNQLYTTVDVNETFFVDVVEDGSSNRTLTIKSAGYENLLATIYTPISYFPDAILGDTVTSLTVDTYIFQDLSTANILDLVTF